MADNTKLFYVNLDVESDERYDLSKFLQYTDNFDPLNSAFMSELMSLQKGGEYVVSKEEGRPDLVSYNIYGSTQYWHIILLYNGLDDVDAITVNKRLSFPSLAALEDLYFGLKSRQSSSDKESQT